MFNFKWLTGNDNDDNDSEPTPTRVTTCFGHSDEFGYGDKLTEYSDGTYTMEEQEHASLGVRGTWIESASASMDMDDGIVVDEQPTKRWWQA